MRQRQIQLSINRNIMECKVFSPFYRIAPADSINRNIMECKVRSIGIKSPTLNGINRNIMECKATSLTNATGAHYVLIET